jgi:hypothetical protein
VLKLDHLAVACETLEEGAAWVSDMLGVPLQKGGEHLRYGTHNMLLGLEDGLYLEVIAVNRDLPPTSGTIWFGLSAFSGRPRLANWICASDDLTKLLADAPSVVGIPRDLERGDLRWQITVPEDGSLPYEGAFPTLMQWAEGTSHPASRLAPSGCRLVRLIVRHPEAEQLREIVPLNDPRVVFESGPFGLTAAFDTPLGRRMLA